MSGLKDKQDGGQAVESSVGCVSEVADKSETVNRFSSRAPLNTSVPATVKTREHGFRGRESSEGFESFEDLILRFAVGTLGYAWEGVQAGAGFDVIHARQSLADCLAYEN